MTLKKSPEQYVTAMTINDTMFTSLINKPKTTKAI